MEKRLTSTYLLAITIIASILIISQLAIQLFLTEQKNDGRIINIAGRQRMLSQRIVKYVLLLQQFPNQNHYKEELRKAYYLFKSSHENLEGSSKSMKLNISNSKEIQEQFSHISPSYHKITEIVEILLIRVNTPSVNISELLLAEKSFLPQMNDIVFTYDAENKEKVIKLSKIEYAALGITLFILVLEVFIIFRPMVKRIQRNRLDILEKNNKLKNTNEELQNYQEELVQQNSILNENQNKLRNQQHLLNKNNLELKSYQYTTNQSINAAKLIQQSMLPVASKIHTVFSNCFILYKPRDIVSGDFYWIHNKGEKHVFIEADCTGHGVAGAFMTIIGNSILDQIIKIEKIFSPKKIMEKMHQSINTILQQEKSGDWYGMDMSILVLYKREDKFHITCGMAGQSLYYTSGKDFIELSGVKKRIGGLTNPKMNFEEHFLELSTEEKIYLASDGYADQNNAQRKRYGKKAFKQLLEGSRSLSLREQKETIINELENHMANTTQRDDITVIGLQL